MLHRIIFTWSMLLSLSAFAQDGRLELSLEECIDLAIENNLDLRRAELQAETSEVHLKQSQNVLLPNLNASINGGVNNGRSIDPFSNTYVEDRLSYSNAGLGLDATVFNGFRIKNSIRRDRFNLKASEMETEEARQSLILDVTLAYLQIRNHQDLVNLAELRMESTSSQMDRLEILHERGEGNPADYTDIQGQYASDRTQLVNAEQALEEAVLHLSTLINTDSEIMPKIPVVEPVLETYSISAAEVFQDALEFLPGFKAGQLRVEAAQKDVSVSKSLYSPEVSIFAQLNTNYSSAARLYNEHGSVRTETGEFVRIDGQNHPVVVNEPQYLASEMPFHDQFNNNLNSVVGASVDIPLFNGFRAKNEIALKRIRLEESEVALEDRKLQLRQSIKQAHSAMEAAYRQYLILQEQVVAFEESFRVNEIRFNSGVSNMVEYIISKNNMERAIVNFTNAQYEYLLRVKVLEYYRGNMYSLEEEG